MPLKQNPPVIYITPQTRAQSQLHSGVERDEPGRAGRKRPIKYDKLNNSTDWITAKTTAATTATKGTVGILYMVYSKYAQSVFSPGSNAREGTRHGHPLRSCQSSKSLWALVGKLHTARGVGLGIGGGGWEG